MKENFAQVMKFVLAQEGGYVNDPRDPGGPTNLGVTICTYSHELGCAATIDQMKCLTPAAVIPIYQKKYWNVIGGDGLAAGVDLLAMDICVNMGVGRVLPWLQSSNNMRPSDRIAFLDNKRRSFWRSLKTWAIYGKGWSKREDACLKLALSMSTDIRRVA